MYVVHSAAFWGVGFIWRFLVVDLVGFGGFGMWFRLCVLRAFRWLAYDRFCLGVAIVAG